MTAVLQKEIERRIDSLKDELDYITSKSDILSILNWLKNKVIHFTSDKDRYISGTVYTSHHLPTISVDTGKRTINLSFGNNVSVSSPLDPSISEKLNDVLHWRFRESRWPKMTK